MLIKLIIGNKGINWQHFFRFLPKYTEIKYNIYLKLVFEEFLKAELERCYMYIRK